MTKETMNIHRALSEQKMIDERIKKEIANTTFVSCHIAGNKKVDGISTEDFVKNAHAKDDKIRDLMARRDALHRAIQQSNAVTKVKIGGVEYTVAEAIWVYNYGTKLLAVLRDTISKQYNIAVKTVNCENNALEAEADKYITNVYGGNKDIKNDAEVVAQARQLYIDSRKQELVDPLNAAKYVDDLTERIETFNSEVNTVLSTSNAITEITIEY